ncbi:transcription factor bHLH144-like [Pyrus ussuriensis x Pyrus communis]|uniref:Transcription factor bHLH144-like n=1 Tax=Pyrus ussuriensis x Pyrus communis TaxID=2448454 RepID=A0A5N5FEZ5_9ROSA|nr:transcription factor bHLH144-like [Pyrus ussuriensis x Pyrus communis]
MVVNAQNAWCVANPAAQEEALHSAVDYACSYVDCSPTVKGGFCFYPDTSVQHASYAMNAYYQKMGRKQWNCYFTNTGLISLTDPRGSGPPLPQKKDTWCVAKPGIPDSELQEIIDFACGVLKDCSKIQEHGSCFLPNTLISHASFAMNLYYKADAQYNCDFNGAGQVVVTNPRLVGRVRMNIGVNVKKYRAIKEVGKILMSVGVIAYSHQMQVCQSDQQFDPNKAAPPFSNQVGNNYMHIPVASGCGAVLPNDANHFKPFHGVEFQTSSICPKNFIIFDQTDHRSQIMFNPEISHKITGPAFNLCAAYIQDNLGLNEGNIDNREASSTLKEDSDDIDALLSLEEEELEDYDEEEVSTARTRGNYGSSFSDSCSSYGLKTKKEGLCSSLEKSTAIGSSSSCNSERKRQKMKKMVRALRGIVPGGNEMNTVAVLDEAVQYLKSLKVELQKLGVENLND